MKKKPKNIPSLYKFEGTQIFRDTTALPFLNGGPLVDKTNHGKLLNSIYASALGDYYRTGGQFPTPYSLPEDSFKQGGRNLHNSVYASSPGQYPAPYNFGGTLHNNLATRQQMYMPLDHITREGGSILSMSNTPQMEGEGKDLAYQNGGHMYPDGGQFYTYSGRPGATYQKVNNQWYIQTEKTNGKFIPVQDPTGKRTALLNSKATPIAMTTNKYQRTYDPLLDNTSQVAENTVPKNSFDAGMQKSMQTKLNQGAAENQAVRAETINAIKNSSTLSEEQKNEILLDPRKVEELKYLGENVVYGNPNQGTIKEFDPNDKPSRAWEIATNPFTAFEYAVSGGGVENMPHNINEMRVAGIDPGVVQGRNLVGNALNSNLNLLDAGDKFKRYTQQGNYLGALGEGLRFLPAGAGAIAGTKTLVNQAERLGVKNVINRKASVGDLFKRDDLYNIKTPESLANYKKALAEGKVSATTNRFYSTESNPDFLNYAGDESQVFVHRVPHTKAASAGKSLGKIKPKGDALVARQRSIPHAADVDELIASGELAGYSDETLQSLREIADKPEGYWNLDAYKNNPELQKLVADPHLVNHNEHFLRRPTVEDFTLTNVEDITKNRPALIDVNKIGNDAIKGYENLNPLGIAGSTAVPNPVEEIDKYKLGGTMNFKSNADYHKWLAYGHASGAFEKTPGNQPVSIKGNTHSVQHASGGFTNAGFMALPKEVQDKIRSRAFADGGPMEAQLTEFTEGGRHEENPLGGIPQGTAPDGKLNLVEQGETKLNSANYIFSDTLKVDKPTADMFALPKSDVGKTFAELSKKLNRPNSRRENDTIEQVAIKRDLDNLMNAQEDFKQKEVQKKIEEINSLDPNALAGLQQGAPEQMQGMQEMPQGQIPQSVQPMGMPEGQPVDPNQIPPEMLAQMPEAQAGQPVMAMGGGMYKCGGKMYNFGGSMYATGGRLMFNGGATLENPYAQNNGLNGAANNGLNNSNLQDQGFRDYGAGTGAEAAATPEEELAGNNSAGKSAIGGAMGGIGAAIGGGGMANAPTADKNAQAAQGVKSGIVGAVTAINPIVGGIIGLGQGIGTAVRKKTEAVDENGQLLNEGKAERGYVAGHLFDPVGAAIEDWSNPNLNTGQKILSTIGLSALNRKAYSEGLEKNARKNMGITGSAANPLAPGEIPQEGQPGYNGAFAQSSGNGFRDGGFAHNAGPMGQPLTNLYALGGPGDPTTATTPVTHSAPAIATYNPTLGSDYASNYAASLAGYNNNPKDPKTGIPMYGSGGADAGSATGTGGDYRPYTSAERAARIKMIEGLPAAELRPDYLEEYQILKNNRPYFVNPSQSDKFIYEPYDLRKYTPPTAESLTTMYPPAADPNALKQNYYTDANTGQVVMDYDAKTGKMVPRAMEGLTTGSRQYSQPLEQMANDPARLAAKAAQSQQRNENVELLRSMTEEQKAAMRAAGQSPRQFLGTATKEMGGSLDSPTEDDMISHLTNLEQSATTHSFWQGGGFNFDRDMFGNIKRSNVDYDALHSEANLDNPWDKESVDKTMQYNLIDPDKQIDYSKMTPEQLEEYLSELQRANEELRNNNKDLNMNQTIGQGIGQLLPAAYNIGQGIFGKVGTLDPKQFYQKADFQPWEYNINPQLKEVQRSYAQFKNAAQNAAPSGGAYMSNMQVAALGRNDAMAKLYAEKQNVDAANALDAKVRNKAIEASNKGILSNITDYNIKAKEAKRQMLATGLKQGADAARSAAEMDAQAAYMKLLAPDFAGTFNYNTIFDQGVAKLLAAKEAKKSKKDKEG